MASSPFSLTSPTGGYSQQSVAPTSISHSILSISFFVQAVAVLEHHTRLSISVESSNSSFAAGINEENDLYAAAGTTGKETRALSPSVRETSFFHHGTDKRSTLNNGFRTPLSSQEVTEDWLSANSNA